MKNKFSFKKYLRIIRNFLIIIIILVGLILAYNLFFTHKVFVGVYLDNFHMYNQSYSQVYNFLEEGSRFLNEKGLEYKFKDKSIFIRPITTTLDDPDLSHNILEFDNQSTAEEVFKQGRNSDYKDNILEQLKMLFIRPQQIKWKYSINEAEWKNILENNFKEFETEFKAPAISFENNNIVISEPADGEEFNYDYVLEITKAKIENFDFSLIELDLNEIVSNIDLVEAEEQKEKIQEIIDLESITLNYDQRYWKISSWIYRDWLILKRNEVGEIIVGFDFDKYEKHFQENILDFINRESRNAKFKIQNGRVIEFQGSQDGRELDLKETLNVIEESINNFEPFDSLSSTQSAQGKTEIDLAVNIIKADVETVNVNDLGIQEVIGIGESDFKGSPPNRVHNIETGAAALSGLLIAPGEEFSTIGGLRPVNAENGYLPELVIKGNKTIPEYGGGLCQIGTTIYRAVLHSGLKITQRRPHSYRVSYYEPAGMDATIYDPWPDMKFINDTSKHILIQTRIIGTKLYFDFWGAKDGRQITVTDPIIYNIVGSGPTKEIETEDLEPGKRKCTESAHAGADAYFDYKVEYADDREIYEERVSSHYVPWSAVCLIGVEKISEDEEDDEVKADEEIIAE